MVDSKCTKKSRSQHNGTWAAIVFIVGILFCCVFFYWLWFHSFLGSPVTTQQVVFEFSEKDNAYDINNSDSTLNIIDKKDFEEIQKLAQDIIETNKDISKKIKNSEYLSVSNLNGFYAALFTFLAVIAGVVGFVRWKWGSRYKIDMDNFKIDMDDFKKETKDIFERERKKTELVDWTEKQFQELIDKEKTELPDDPKLDEIKMFVIKEFTRNSELETFYAYHLAFPMDEKGKNIDDMTKAKLILSSVINRDLIEDLRLKASIYHIQGQINSGLYLFTSRECNFFMSSDERLETPPAANIEKIINYLSESALMYKDSYFVKKKTKQAGINETRGNFAMVLIELHKFSRVNEQDDQKNENIKKLLADIKTKLTYKFDVKDFLPLAAFLQGEIKDKTFNQIWDETRRIYYENRFEDKKSPGEWSDKENEIWERDIKKILRDEIDERLKWHDLEQKWPSDKRRFFLKQLKKEIREFNNMGFPGKEKFITDDIETIINKK